jgi:hypothetical protein
MSWESKNNLTFLTEISPNPTRDDEEGDGGAETAGVPFQKGTRRHTDSESKVSKVLGLPHVPPSLPSGPYLPHSLSPL